MDRIEPITLEELGIAEPPLFEPEYEIHKPYGKNAYIRLRRFRMEHVDDEPWTPEHVILQGVRSGYVEPRIAEQAIAAQPDILPMRPRQTFAEKCGGLLGLILLAAIGLLLLAGCVAPDGARLTGIDARIEQLQTETDFLRQANRQNGDQISGLQSDLLETLKILNAHKRQATNPLAAELGGTGFPPGNQLGVNTPGPPGNYGGSGNSYSKPAPLGSAGGQAPREDQQ